MRENDDSNSPGPERRDPVLPESELVRLCRQGDESAWVRLIERYSNLVYSTIRRVGLGEDDAEEAFQNTIVAIYEQLGDLRRPEALVSWIVGIAYRQSIDRIRAKTRDVKLLTGTQINVDSSGALPGSTQLPDTDLRRLERHQSIEEGLQSLPGRCPELLRRLFYANETRPDYTEVARDLDMPVGSIGPTRARCLEKLRRSLRVRGWSP